MGLSGLRGRAGEPRVAMPPARRGRGSTRATPDAAPDLVGELRTLLVTL
jgi:hypothetical protein